jgi:hypothetical protein
MRPKRRLEKLRKPINYRYKLRDCSEVLTMKNKGIKLMVEYDFGYLVEKIKKARFETDPFKHVYIEDFFTSEHLEQILSSVEISSPRASTDIDLIKGLQEKGFKPISFPGCVSDIKKYVDWHEGGKQVGHHSACEGFGMALRLYDFQTQILNELNSFLAGDAFNKAIAEKFDIEYGDCTIDGGIQKYLDGYEISPHPDIRKKAATFMVNINPSQESEGLNHHTHYLKLKKPYTYVQEFWNGNENVERAWVPWSWAETIKEQRKNNSIVLFSPSNDTIHGVKADYNHLKTQRTQLYGNLWYKQSPINAKIEWEQLDLMRQARRVNSNPSLKKRFAAAFPETTKIVRKWITGKGETGKRNI